MSLSTLKNTSDSRASNRGDGARNGHPGQPQAQSILAHQAPAPKLRSQQRRFEEFHAHWALLPATGQKLKGSPEAIQLPPPRPSPLPPPMPPMPPVPVLQPPRAAVVTAESSRASELALTNQEPRPPQKQKPRKNGNASSALSASISKEIARLEKEGRALLANAIEILDFDIVSQIIRQDPTLIRKLDADGRSMLGHAASLGSKEMVWHLLALESRVAKPHDGETPLVMLRDKRKRAPIHHAIHSGQWNVIEMLLKAGTPLDVRSGGARLPLLAHAVCKNKSVVSSLLACLPANELDQTDDFGRTAMHMAIRFGDADTLSQLLKAGCTPNPPDHTGETPLHLAAMENQTEFAKQLLATSPANINAATSAGETPLHLAAKAGNEEMVRILIEAGAQIDVPDERRWTALATATNNGHLNIIRYLLSHHANPVFGDKFWAQPLTLALASGDQNRIDIFRRRGKLTWQHMSRATRRAVTSGSPAMVKACLSSGKLESELYPQEFLWALLDAAVERGDPDIVGLVCDKFKRKYSRHIADHYLERVFLTAHARGQFDLLLPIIQRIKHLRLDSDVFQKLIADAQACKDYALIEAIRTTKLVVKGVRISELSDKLLTDPLALEVMNQPKAKKSAFASLFRKPNVPADLSIDATNTASQLAIDLTSLDPATALGATLSAQKISGLLHQPLASSLIPLLSVFSTAGNLKLAQAQYIVGFGLAQYLDPEQLTLPDELVQLNASENLLKKCDAHREALAEAGEVMLDNADNRIADDFVPVLAEIAFKTPVTTMSDRESAIADKLATEFGLLPIWATRMAKVCIAALTTTTSNYRKTFNISQPPAEMLAKLASSIIQQFAEAKRAAAAPEGFSEAALQLSPTEYQQFDALIWRQWDRITQAMAAHAERQHHMDRDDTSTNSNTDKRSDSALSISHDTLSAED